MLTASDTDIFSDSAVMLVTAVSCWPSVFALSDAGFSAIGWLMILRDVPAAQCDPDSQECRKGHPPVSDAAAESQYQVRETGVG
jgi:hypothetical protein